MYKFTKFCIQMMWMLLEARFWDLVSRNQIPERLKHLSDPLAKKIVRFQRYCLSTAIVH